MPIYEYRCNHCGHELETIQKLSEAPLTFCPACETEGLKKKISAAVFRLRGSGWYETDFKSDNKKNVAGDDSAEKEGSGGKAKQNGEDKTGQEARSDTGTEKSAKGERSDGKAKEKSKGDAKAPASKTVSAE